MGAPGGTPHLAVDRTLDCLGLFCPMPIVKTREAMAQMTAGQVLEMLSDDPASDPDMRSWARRAVSDNGGYSAQGSAVSTRWMCSLRCLVPFRSSNCTASSSARAA